MQGSLAVTEQLNWKAVLSSVRAGGLIALQNAAPNKACAIGKPDDEPPWERADRRPLRVQRDPANSDTPPGQLSPPGFSPLFPFGTGAVALLLQDH